MESGALAVGPVSSPLRRSRLPTRAVLIGAGTALVIALVAGYAWRQLNRGATRQPAAAGRVFTQITRGPGLEQFPSLSPDGKWIVYDGDQAGNSDIYLQGVGGQKAINLTADSPDDDTQPAFSPDGERIAFRSERQDGGIFVMGRTGESVRRITDNGYTPAWSPDGRRLVFATDAPNVFGRTGSQLWIVTLASGDKSRVEENDAVQPSWSPNGFRIAYWAVFVKGGIQGQRDIYTIPAEGGTPLAVTADAAIDWNPVWSSDGRHLYFSSNRGGSMNVWRVAIDERSGQVSGPAEAITAPSAFAGHLSVSRDGRQLALASVVQNASVQKVSFDPDSGTIGGDPVTVLSGSRFLSHVMPSPDGQWLACHSIGNQLDILLSRSDGTGERELTHDEANDRNPTWSADGQLIAFYSNRSGMSQIWSIKPDGSGMRQLTFAPQGVSSYNIWSPDGSRMVYVGGGTDADKMFVFEPHKSWHDQAPQPFSRQIEPGRMFTPSAWSPDATQLLGRDERGSVFTYSLSSGRFTRLNAGREATWLHDGRRVLLTDGHRLLLFDTASKVTRELLSIAPDDFDSVALSVDNRMIYFTRATQQGDIWLTTFK